MPELSISTWSLHHGLGKAWFDDTPDGYVNRSELDARLQLLDVPGEISSHGIRNLEICHFHFPATDESYISRLRDALDKHGVSLFSILIDAWDITNPDDAGRESDLANIREWIDIASACGASNVRVVAGESEASPEAIDLSVHNLLALADYASEKGVGVMTENFKKLTQRADPVVEIMEKCNGKIGLCTDFGNFKGEHKLTDLAKVLPYADSIHTKADYEDGEILHDQFAACMNLTREADFTGYYTLIFQDPGEEWTYLNGLKEEVVPYL